eukprot:COSAG02_NODE_2762_length_8074_cov_96.690408_13_plen_283_part_00
MFLWESDASVLSTFRCAAPERTEYIFNSTHVVVAYIYIVASGMSSSPVACRQTVRQYARAPPARPASARHARASEHLRVSTRTRRGYWHQAVAAPLTVRRPRSTHIAGGLTRSGIRTMMYMVVVAVAAMLLMMVAATETAEPARVVDWRHSHSTSNSAGRVQRLRDFSDIRKLEPGSPIGAAAQLYGQLAGRGHALRALAGLHCGGGATTTATRSCSPSFGSLVGTSKQASTRWNQTAVISPVDFGADPTGRLDSSGAMSATMNAIAKLCKTQSGHLSFNVT